MNLLHQFKHLLMVNLQLRKSRRKSNQRIIPRMSKKLIISLLRILTTSSLKLFWDRWIMKRKNLQPLKLRVVVLLKAVNPQLQKVLLLMEVNHNHMLNLSLTQKLLLRRSSCLEREFLLTFLSHQQLREFANSRRRWCQSPFGLIPTRNHFLLQLLTPSWNHLPIARRDHL